jgi:hypothetical protein
LGIEKIGRENYTSLTRVLYLGILALDRVGKTANMQLYPPVFGYNCKIDA